MPPRRDRGDISRSGTSNGSDTTAPLTNRRGQPLGVLLVEDESLVALSLQDDLLELGCAVTGWAVSGDDAARLAAAAPPDVVLMDLRIKGERDGIDVACDLHRQYGVPIIFVTGMAGAESVCEARGLRGATILMKPFSQAALRLALLNALAAG